MRNGSVLRRRIRQGTRARCAVGLAAALLLGCANARYVVVRETPLPAEQDVPERRLVCVSEREARAAPGLLGLRTRASVEQYGRERRGDGGAVEEVLFRLVSGEYGRADEVLRARGAELPEYLRRLLVADLASERPGATASSALLRLYQDAYDAQETERGRAIVELRVRQVRFGR